MLKKIYLTPAVKVTELDTCAGLMLSVSNGENADNSEVESRRFFNEGENDKSNFWGF